MEAKKSKKASLEGYALTDILLGLIVALGFLFIAFEFSQKDIKYQTIDEGQSEVVEEEMVEVTRRFTPPPPPPPKTVQADLLDIVEDNTLDEDIEFESAEDNEDIAVEPEPPVQEEEYKEDEIFTIVEEMPEFPGGNAALQKYIYSHVTYPAIATENGIQGRVICRFVIGKTGKPTNVTVLRGVAPSLDQEAIRVIKGMPAWKPGKQRGKAVRVNYTLPIMFKLQ